jgi:DNA-binding MarR family transcriptional regulator
MSTSGASTSGDLRDEIVALQREVQVLFAAQRRLLWRSKRKGTSTTPDRLNALLRLSEGETTHGQLVRDVQMNPATVSILIDNLVGRRLVRRRQDAHDGRVWWLSLTPEGQAEVDRLNANWEALLEAAFDGVSDHDLRATREVLERLTKLFDSVDAEVSDGSPRAGHEAHP